MASRGRFLEIFLACAAALAAAGVAVRVLVGPYRIAGFGVSSPLGCESLFAVSLLLILLVRAGRAESAGQETSKASSFYLPLLALPVLAIFANTLTVPFVSDDYILIRTSLASPARTLALFKTPGGDGSFRPLGDLYFALVRLWAGHDPLKWHLTGLLIHLANCMLLYVLVTRLWRSRRLAFLAVLLFGVHGTRVEAVTWTASSFDLLAAFCVLASAALFFSRVPVGSGGYWRSC